MSNTRIKILNHELPKQTNTEAKRFNILCRESCWAFKKNLPFACCEGSPASSTFHELLIWSTNERRGRQDIESWAQGWKQGETKEISTQTILVSRSARTGSYTVMILQARIQTWIDVVVPSFDVGPFSEIVCKKTSVKKRGPTKTDPNVWESQCKTRWEK